MIVQRISIFCLLLLSLILPQSIYAAERLEVEIRSTVLNIRETRSTHSPVVGVLNAGDRLTVTTTDQRDWVHLDDGRGFISIHYVNVLSRTPVLLAPPEEQSETETQAHRPEPALIPVNMETANTTDGIAYQPSATATDIESTPQSLSAQSNTADDQAIPGHVDNGVDIESVSKTCRKNLHTAAYEFCQLLFKLRLPEDLDAYLNLNQQSSITCSATALVTNKDNIQTLYELSNTRQISQSLSNTSVIVEWSPASESAEAAHVALKAGRCLISLPTR
ncbi:SH3 domain-containing protein [Amphritea sp.]|uniref:SH3 domain-containing protein n=1 Tax=Amphritea sp. TaxID=1872502 RepID=UPI003D12D936